MTRRLTLVSAALAALLALPSMALAQSGMTGTVRDTSGAVLPGVTVEASSEALIEKSKVAVTDGEGRFLITDLRPGQYVVTFTLTGFASIRREGIQLPSEFTATVNAEMRVGALEESITVTGAAPLVDVTTAARTQVLNREAIDIIPTGRTIQGLGQLIVGINLNLPDTGGARAMQQTYMSTHGMSAANNTVMVDGMIVNGLQADGAVQMYFNDAMNQEMSYQTAGIGAETASGGVRLNMIPREGGNRFSGDFKGAYRPGEWQSDNVSSRLQGLGLAAGTGNATDRIFDATFAEGGPLMRDKLWFFGSARYFTVNNFIADTFFRDGSRGVDDQFIKSALLRLTWQITPTTKFAAYHDEVDKYRGHDMQRLYVPEESAREWGSPAYHTQQAKLTSTLTNRLLLEGGYSSNLEYYTLKFQPGTEFPRGTPEWFATAARHENDLGGRKTASDVIQSNNPARFNVQTSLSYVTGSHQFKAGVQYQWGSFWRTEDTSADIITQNYRSNSTGIPWTVPDTVTIRNTPLIYGSRLNRDIGAFVQDSWAMKRLTINAGLRMDHMKAQVLASTSPAGRWVPARSFDAIENLPLWTNWAPRLSVVYDLFGNSKTALKYSVNRYNRPYTTGIAEGYNPLAAQSATLQWRDVNGDDIAQGTRGCTPYPSVGCEINFASLAANYGTAALNEYGNYERLYKVEQGLEIQHEVARWLSASASWYNGGFRRWSTTVNRAWEFGGDPLLNPNYVPYTLYNPVTGEPITVYGRTAAAQAAPTSNLDAQDPTRKQLYNAVNLEFNARPGMGARLFGGVNLEQTLAVNCYTPDNPNSQRFCDERELGIPWNKTLKLAGSIPLPFDITLSGALQSNQAPNSARVMTATRGTTRYPSTCPAPCPAGAIILPSNVFAQSTLTVDLVPGSSVFNERITQLDIKASKTFRIGRVSVQPQFEAFNIFNADTIVSYLSTNVLASSFLRPNSIVQPRMVGVATTVRW
jgi:hypothetical protein